MAVDHVPLAITVNIYRSPALSMEDNSRPHSHGVHFSLASSSSWEA